MRVKSGILIKKSEKISIFFTIVSIILISTANSADDKSKKSTPKSDVKICVTFDELPASESFDARNQQVTMQLIMDTLKAHNVKAAGFVIGKNIEGDYDLLGKWLNDGHRLGNMSYSFSDLHEIGIEQFLIDIRKGNETLETMLSGFGQQSRYFRYPYLHYGKDQKAREYVSAFLEDHGMTVVHTTVVVEDYLYNLSLQKMGDYPDSLALVQLMNEYINHVIDQVERSEALSIKILGRSCRQILQLKANRLNSLFLGDLLSAFEKEGYVYITIDEALKDKLYD
ncbi:MAG: polysaccharide deacetylase family protein, partial [bacterium]